MVLQSVANAHVQTELCCKSWNTGLDITDISICLGAADDDLTGAHQLTGSPAEDFDQIRSEEVLAACSCSISCLAGTVKQNNC